MEKKFVKHEVLSQKVGELQRKRVVDQQKNTMWQRDLDDGTILA